MKLIMKLPFVLLVLFKKSKCSIDGLTYMDPRGFKAHLNSPVKDNPCNPLYWYPRQIPEHCYSKGPDKNPPAPVPPIPVPIPPQTIPINLLSIPAPMPAVPNLLPVPNPLLSLQPPSIPIPMHPIANTGFGSNLQPSPISLSSSAVYGSFPFLSPPIAPALPMLPYGVPIIPTNPMIPIAGLPNFMNSLPISSGRVQAGFVPGIPGIVSPDGGINILPFSDVYSDLLEKNKNIQLRKQLQKVLHRYGESPKQFYRRHGRH